MNQQRKRKERPPVSRCLPKVGCGRSSSTVRKVRFQQMIDSRKFGRHEERRRRHRRHLRRGAHDERRQRFVGAARRKGGFRWGGPEMRRHSLLGRWGGLEMRRHSLLGRWGEPNLRRHSLLGRWGGPDMRRYSLYCPSTTHWFIWAHITTREGEKYLRLSGPHHVSEVSMWSHVCGHKVNAPKC